ncbi:MAG: ATP-binding protein, partial [Anaerolineales bacterium]|nr:ATP-binding protein [Anaerolineales bacterium]
ETVEPQSVRKDITISFQEPEPLSLIEGDEGTLIEAIVNLLTNSVKYTQMGGKIELSVKETPAAIQITVSDNGVGIANEDISFIFADFYRGKNLPEGERSSGLGLSITKRIIEAHHGSIQVESELGKGSVFTIKLPKLENSLKKS